jgi:hypothetical protein
LEGGQNTSARQGERRGGSRERSGRWKEGVTEACACGRRRTSGGETRRGGEGVGKWQGREETVHSRGRGKGEREMGKSH